MIAAISRQIHKRQTILWQIQKANEGVPLWVLAYKDESKREDAAIKARKELNELLDKRKEIMDTTPREKWYPNRKRSGRTKLSTDSTKRKVDKWVSYRNKKFFCSDGTKVSQYYIDQRRGEALKAMYGDIGKPIDAGFREQRATCTAYIISQSRCKQLGKTELIWDIENMFPATWESNRAIENPKGQEWKRLHNKAYCLSFIQKHDSELYQKFVLNP